MRATMIAFALIRAEHLDVARGKTGVEQALGHRVGGNGGAANRIGGIDFNELLENVVRELLGAVVHLREQRTGD